MINIVIEFLHYVKEREVGEKRPRLQMDDNAFFSSYSFFFITSGAKLSLTRVVQGVLCHGSLTEKIEGHGSRI